MTFEEILDHAIAMIQRRGRLTYGTLKRQFQLDDAALEDLKNELIEGQRLAVMSEATSWSGPEPRSPLPTRQRPLPVARTVHRSPTPPQHLTEQVLHSHSALEGERKQVTVLLA